MIISFSVENFRSIKNKETFTLNPDSGKSKSDNLFSIELEDESQVELLKTAVIYGANGSGKSNFIKAFYALRWFVTHSMDFKVGQNIGCFEPFELDEDSLASPTTFELNFILKKIKYKYKISFRGDVVLSEILDYYPLGKPANLFSRFSEHDNAEYVEVILGKKLVDKRIQKRVFVNQLYLSKFGSDIPHDHLTEVYKYFDALEIRNTLDRFDIRELSKEVSKTIANPENEKFNQRLSKLIRIADTKIESIYARELDAKDFNFPDALPENIKNEFIKQNKLTTFAKHKRYKDGKLVGFVEFELNKKESKGTIVLFALGGIVLKALEKGGVVVFDELDNSLHPKLCKFIIRLFNNPVSNPNNAQLIFATHEVTLLDKDVFRKDQIWFVEKDKLGVSEIFCANEVEGLREDSNFELWYRTGKFGGNPKIKEIEFIFGND